MLYSALRPLLFALPPETAHRVTLNALDAAAAAGLKSAYAPRPAATAPVRVMGLDFPNRVGLAAGLDKNAEHIDGLASLGFGYMEVGTVTPRPQPGNPQPRLFRLPQAAALINRMGFNNAGVNALLANIAKSSWRGVLGVNIGKNFDTPLERAADDYLACLDKVYAVASYVAVNISSPNTEGLRNLQQGGELDGLLDALKKEQEALTSRHGRYVPLTVKLAPDLDDTALEQIAGQLLAHGVEGVIATNTTTSREGVSGLPSAEESGGLSGRPLQKRSTNAIAVLAGRLGGRIPIIGVGGILEAADAREKLAAGASLIQLYTGLIYRGPGLIGEVLRETSGC
jgi:dihydroorotate dehydrogenase